MPIYARHQRPGIALSNIIRYPALDVQRREIRLFRLTNIDTDAVSGDLEVFELANAPPYQALSYRWGKTHPAKELRIGGQQGSIRMNLWRFLTSYLSVTEANFSTMFPNVAALSRTPRETYLWIDQICIDQSNVDERSNQVSLMAEIFSNAVDVICWPSNSRQELELIGSALAKWRDEPLRHGIAHRGGSVVLRKRTIGRAEKALVKAAYWDRMWIQQELLLAQHITVFNGPYALDWEDLAHDIAYEGQGWEKGTLTSLIERRRAMLQGNEPQSSLTAAFADTRLCSATDRKDYIYALMGLVKQSEKLPVDYSIPKELLWWLAIRKITLEVPLQMAGTYSPKSELRHLLYSQKAANLDVADEIYRQFIIDFVMAFWTAWSTDQHLTLRQYEIVASDPYQRFLEWKVKPWRWAARQAFPFQRVLNDVWRQNYNTRPDGDSWLLSLVVCVLFFSGTAVGWFFITWRLFKTSFGGAIGVAIGVFLLPTVSMMQFYGGSSFNRGGARMIGRY